MSIYVFTCPFCGVQDDSLDKLQSHLEHAHAEGDRGATHGRANIAGEFQEPQEQSDADYALQLALAEAGLDPALGLSINNRDAPSRRSKEERETATEHASFSSDDSDDQDELDEYVECPCGERVTLAEIEEHSSLHADEDMDLPASALPLDVEYSTGSRNDKQAVRDISNSFSTDIPRSIRNHDQTFSKTHYRREGNRSFSLKELFLGDSSLKKRRSPSNPVPPSIGNARRLGVSSASQGGGRPLTSYSMLN